MGVDYADGLILAATFIRHDSIARDAVVTYAMTADVPYASTEVEYANFLQDAFTDNWASQIDNGAVINRTTVLLGHGDDAPTLGESTHSPVPGTGSGSMSPPSVAVVVKKLTGFGGRLNRGRVYIPFSLHDDDVDERGAFAGSALSDRQDAADAWLDAIKTSITRMVIANRNYDRAWDVKGRRLESVDAGREVTALQVESVIGTQRRRLAR